MTEGAAQFSLLLEDASAVPGAPDGAAHALVETFGLPFPVAQRILASLPALVLKDQTVEVAEQLAQRLTQRGFVVRVRGPGRTRQDLGSAAQAAIAAASASGDVPLVGIRRRTTTTGAHSVPRDSGSVSAVTGRRGAPTGVQRVVAERNSGPVDAVDRGGPVTGATPTREEPGTRDSGGFGAVRAAPTMRTSEPLGAPDENGPRPGDRPGAAPPVTDPADNSHPTAGPAIQTPLPFDEPRGAPPPLDDAFSFEQLEADLPPLDLAPPSVPVPRVSAASGAFESGSSPVLSSGAHDDAPPATGDALGVPDVRSRLLDELAALDESGISHFAMRPSFSADDPSGPRPKPSPPPVVEEAPAVDPLGDPSGAFRRVEAPPRRAAPSRSDAFEQQLGEPAARREDAEPPTHRDAGGFERAEPSIRRDAGGFERAEPSIRMASSEVAGERPRIQFEAAVMASSPSIDDELRDVSGLYDDAARGSAGRSGGGARTTGSHAAVGARTTGSHHAVGMVSRGPVEAAPKQGGGGAIWKVVLGVVLLIGLGVVVQQVASRAVGASVFDRAARLHVITERVGGRASERACADLGEGRAVCRFNTDYFLAAFPAIDRPVAELAADECTAERSDDGTQMSQSMVCRLRWEVAGDAREYLLVRRTFRTCDRSLLTLPAGEATTCEFAVESEMQRGNSGPNASRASERRMLRMEGNRATLDTPAGYVDAIEFVSTPIGSTSGGGTRMVHYAPSLREFVRETTFGMAPDVELTYRRVPGREEGSWAGAD